MLLSVKKKGQRGFIGLGWLVLAFVAVNTGLAQAADLTLMQPLYFGIILADPRGETIEIDGSQGPSSSPRVVTSGNSYIKDGNSGMIRVQSDISGQEIMIEYPISVVLTTGGGATLVLDGIAARSTGSTTSTGVGPVDFYLGGLLHIGSGQAGNDFSGTMTITVNVVNP